MSGPPTRRAFLHVLAGGAFLGAGCTTDSDDPATAVESTPTTRRSTPTPTRTRFEYPTTEPAPDLVPLDATGNWPTPHHDAANTRTGQTSGVPDSGERRWVIRPRGTPPALGGDVLYRGEYGSDPGRVLVARSLRTGEQRWSAPLPGGAVGLGPVLDDAGIVSLSYARLHAFDRDGTKQWEYDPPRGSPTLPIATDDAVYACNGAFSESPAVLFAVDRQTGEERWLRRLDADPTGSLALGDETLVLPVESGDVTGYDLAGETRWTRTFDATPRTPTVHDGTVYLLEDDATVHALSLGDGATQWTTDLDAEEGGSGLAVADGRVLAPVPGGVVALDAADGTVQWGREWTGDRPATAPAVADETVYYGDDQQFVAADLGTGERRWTYWTEEFARADVVDAGVRGPPVVADGGVLVEAAPGLFAFGPASE